MRKPKRVVFSGMFNKSGSSTTNFSPSDLDDKGSHMSVNSVRSTFYRRTRRLLAFPPPKNTHSEVDDETNSELRSSSEVISNKTTGNTAQNKEQALQTYMSEEPAQMNLLMGLPTPRKPDHSDDMVDENSTLNMSIDLGAQNIPPGLKTKNGPLDKTMQPTGNKATKMEMKLKNEIEKKKKSEGINKQTKQILIEQKTKKMRILLIVIVVLTIILVAVIVIFFALGGLGAGEKSAEVSSETPVTDLVKSFSSIRGYTGNDFA